MKHPLGDGIIEEFKLHACNNASPLLNGGTASEGEAKVVIWYRENGSVRFSFA